MRNASLLTICLILIGIAGFNTLEAKNNKKPDLYMHSFTCDSLGVEKSVFDRNEKWYACFIVRNDSNHPIKYKVLQPILLEVDYFKHGGKPRIMTFDDLDPEDCQVYILNPHEQISEIRECHHDSNIKAGKYNTIMYYFTYFLDDKYEKHAYKQLRHHIPFYVR